MIRGPRARLLVILPLFVVRTAQAHFLYPDELKIRCIFIVDCSFLSVNAPIPSDGKRSSQDLGPGLFMNEYGPLCELERQVIANFHCDLWNKSQRFLRSTEPADAGAYRTFSIAVPADAARCNLPEYGNVGLSSDQ
jgi:hypothetical protein